MMMEIYITESEQRFREDVASRYPHGHFILRKDEQVLADSADFEELAAIANSGKYPGAVIDRVGHELGGTVVSDEEMEEIHLRNLIAFPEEREPNANELAYEKEKFELRSRYPHHQFVAYFDGRIVGDSSDYDTLVESMESQGMSDIMVVRVGDEHPETTELISWI